jgi:CheY-like chemotaxis protein
MVALALDRGRIPGTREASADRRAARIEKVRVLSEMAGGLARELNNVFAVILGKSRLVLARANDEPLREGLTALEEAAWRGADVVHRLGGLVAPSQDEATGAVDLVALVRDVAGEARSRWKHDVEGGGASIDVVADLQPAPPVRGSETILREVLMSLAVNAVDAMGSGGRLTLSTRPGDGGTTVVVDDTGEGIRDDLRERAFDPFFTTRSPKRLGLGLTVAEGVVLRYGGRIDISSLHPPRHGTRVTVWLPEDTSPGNPLAPTAQSDIEKDRAKEQGNPRHSVQLEPNVGPTSTTPSNGVPKPETEHHDGEAKEATVVPAMPPPHRLVSILILEDEEAARSLLVDALTQAGHAVDAVPDALSGLAKLEKAPFDVVLTDLALPEQSGLAVARSVKRLNPQTPVVLITGGGHLLDPGRLREHGVDLMLVKPFQRDRVLSVVSQALLLRAAPR